MPGGGGGENGASVGKKGASDRGGRGERSDSEKNLGENEKCSSEQTTPGPKKTRSGTPRKEGERRSSRLSPFTAKMRRRPIDLDRPLVILFGEEVRKGGLITNY